MNKSNAINNGLFDWLFGAKKLFFFIQNCRVNNRSSLIRIPPLNGIGKKSDHQLLPFHLEIAKNNRWWLKVDEI